MCHIVPPYSWGTHVGRPGMTSRASAMSEDWWRRGDLTDFGSSASGQKASTSLSSSLISLVHWGSHVVFHIFPLIYDHYIMKIHTARQQGWHTGYERITYIAPRRSWEPWPMDAWAKAAKVPGKRMGKTAMQTMRKLQRQRVHDALDVVQLPLERACTGQNCAHGENLAQNFTIPTIPILTCPYLSFGIITVWNEIWLI